MAHILQTFSTLRLYKDALRLADRISKKTGADPRFLKNTIRHEFRKNMHETDPAKIAALREVAIRGILSYMIDEASIMVQKNIPEPPEPPK